jgi:hypothetical protein
LELSVGLTLVKARRVLTVLQAIWFRPGPRRMPAGDAKYSKREEAT